jgi:hypothetical protein
VSRPKPIGFRAYTAQASDHAQGFLVIKQQSFGTRWGARRWVEQGRAMCTKPKNFCSCIKLVYPDVSTEAAPDHP